MAKTPCKSVITHSDRSENTMFQSLKKISIGFLVLILLIISSSLGQCDQGWALLDGSVASEAGTYTVPFQTFGGHILVKTKINDSPKEYTFLLDSAAPMVISKRIVNELKIETVPGGTAVDVMKEKRSVDAVHLKLQVGKVIVENLGSFVDDLKSIESFGFKIDGLLGSNLLKLFQVSIDYRKKELVFARNDSSYSEPNVQTGYLLKLMQNNLGQVSIEIKIGSQTFVGRIDTGAAGCGSDYLLFPTKLLEKIRPELDCKVMNERGITSIAAFSGGRSMSSRITSLEVGTFKVNNLPIGITGDVGILITNDFLSHFNVTIDYLKSLMYLCPNGKPFKTNLNVFGFKAQRDPNGKLKIVGLWEGSSAERNGLQIGDEITNIALVNGNQISNITFEEYLSVLYDAEAITIRLRIVNDDGTREVELRNEAVLPKI